MPVADAAGRWFLQSGIQRPNGGVARFYRADLGRNLAISTEITGYTLAALTYLHQLTGELPYKRAADRTATFLCEQAWDAELGLFPFEYAEANERVEPLGYFFDCGIIVRGLLRAGRGLEIARQCADSMIRLFQTADGAAHPILTLPSREPLPYGTRWSRRPGCYHLKSALGWLELAEVTGETRYREAYERLLEYALATHETFLPGDPDPLQVMDRLHAYSYFLEALLPYADQARCRAALAHGIEKAGRLLREIAPVFARSDVYGQLLRVRLYAHTAGAVALDEAAAGHEAACAAEFQREDGGFHFGRRDGALIPHINPVSTAFCLQALALWQQFQAGEWTATRQQLI